MYTAVDFKQAFDDYAAFCEELIKKTGAWGGVLKVLGFNKNARDEGHEKFLQEMKNALQQAADAGPDERTADDIIDTIFHAKNDYPEQYVSPYIFPAIESMATGLFPYLSRKKAEELLKEYRHLPYRQRVPVYKQTLAALEKAVKAKN